MFRSTLFVDTSGMAGTRTQEALDVALGGEE
jgi:hypothetical protein